MSRAYKRYKARGGALVAFSIPTLPPIARLRKLVDISRAGLAFEYISNQRQKFTSPELDLFWYKTPDPVVWRIPCKIVYDIGESGVSDKFAQIRRCGIKFGELSKEQEDRLREFIDKYAETTKEVGHEVGHSMN